MFFFVVAVVVVVVVVVVFDVFVLFFFLFFVFVFILCCFNKIYVSVVVDIAALSAFAFVLRLLISLLFFFLVYFRSL